MKPNSRKTSSKPTRQAKSWWIKERHNPQFDSPYYVAMGKISQREAKQWENSIYGDNVMLRFDSEFLYNDTLKKLKRQGKMVMNR